MFRLGGRAKEIFVCVCRFDVEVCGDGVVFVESYCDVEDLCHGR